MAKLHARRLTRHSNKFDQVTCAYIFFERVLWICLFITMTSSIVMAVAAMYFKHYQIYYIEKLFLNADEVINLSKMTTNEIKTLVPILEEANNDDVFLGHWSRMITSFIFTIFWVNFTTVSFGVLSIMMKNIIFVRLFILFNIVCIGLEFIFTHTMIYTDTMFHRGTAEKMTEILQSEYTMGGNAALEKILNSVMVLGKCCGINGHTDFHKMFFDDVNGTKNVVQFPPACCKSTLWDDPKTAYENVMTCMDKGVVNNYMLYNKGCFEIWAKAFVNKTRHFIILRAAAFTLIQLLQLLIGMLISRVATFAMDTDDREGNEAISSMSLVEQKPDKFKFQLRKRSSIILKRKLSASSTLII